MDQQRCRQTLLDTLRGIEKEGLRVTGDAELALTPHPAALGSALSNSWVTTDFSECLLEFITPTFKSIDDSLSFLQATHTAASNKLGDEIIWSASMPCRLPADDQIPLARYGSSNIAQMKTAYRRGLGHRYGRAMQTVAGIHYNFSLPDSYWQQEAEFFGCEYNETYVNQRYFDLIRNFRRHYWLLIYLFGASPCVDPSFVQGRSHLLEKHRKHDLYLPDATSLRMGDLGYQSVAQKSLFICYNELENYIQTLDQAIRTPYPPYDVIGLKSDGVYQQLSTSLLQIENEFYSPIRPKRVTEKDEKPLEALDRRGIQYIEVRCIDISPFDPLGIDSVAIHFLDAFLLSCLMLESPQCNQQEFARIGENQARVVNHGRNPETRIFAGSQQVALPEQGRNLLQNIGHVADILDKANDCDAYSRSVKQQLAKIDDVNMTPSARLMHALETEQCSFVELIQSTSGQYFSEHQQAACDADCLAKLETISTQSLQQQRDIEQADKLSFDDFLAAYYE